MGAGGSVPEFVVLDADHKAKFELKFKELISEGKSEEEAISILKTSTDSATVGAGEGGVGAGADADADADADASPAITIPLTELKVVMDQAIKNGKTPLIVDNSEDDKTNTFFSYQSAIIIDGKKMGLDKTMRNTPIAEIMEGARAKLVSGLKLGYPVVIALTKSVTDFATTFSDEACQQAEDKQGLDFQDGKQSYFPLSTVFQNAGKGLVKQDMLDALFTEEDRKDTHGHAICRDENSFHVVVTSQFSPEDFEEYLFGNAWGLPKPKDWYQFIIIKSDD